MVIPVLMVIPVKQKRQARGYVEDEKTRKNSPQIFWKKEKNMKSVLMNLGGFAY